MILAGIQWEQSVFFLGLCQNGLDTTHFSGNFDGFLFLSPAWGFGACQFSHNPNDMSSKNPALNDGPPKNGWL